MMMKTRPSSRGRTTITHFIDYDLQYKQRWKQTLVKTLYWCGFMWCLVTGLSSIYSLHKGEVEFNLVIATLLFLGTLLPTALFCVIGCIKKKEIFVLKSSIVNSDNTTLPLSSSTSVEKHIVKKKHHSVSKMV